MLPLQQPSHIEPPQLQTPFVQAWLPPQGAQAAPAVPHEVVDCPAYATHVLPSQHPCGHEVASHTHRPDILSHSVPDGHMAQVAAPTPHRGVDSEAYGRHVPVLPPLQQPFGQVSASHVHVPAVVSQRLFPQPAHSTPPVPHWPGVCAAYPTQAVPLQQP